MRRRDTLVGLGALGLGTCLGGCRGSSLAQGTGTPGLKDTAPYPLGVAVMIGQLDDPEWTRAVTRNFSRLTAEWEMKMEYFLQILKPLQFDRAEAFLAFATTHNMQLHGHTLIWYAEDGGPVMRKHLNNKDAFITDYVAYITNVMVHFKGRIRSWDVVNEPITANGSGLRPCIWHDMMGEDYIGIAFEAAHQADPQCDLFLNEYDLELTPAKRHTFLNLVDRLRKNGAPIHGLGSQTHIDANLPKGAILNAVRDLRSTGLKIHMSEIDIGLKDGKKPIIGGEKRQAELLEEILKAYDEVPKAQQFGITFWGLRDKDSWRNRQRTGLDVLEDHPLLFDDDAQPKPLAQVFFKP